MKTPEQMAQEWVRTNTEYIENDDWGREKWHQEGEDCKTAFLAGDTNGYQRGHAAGKQEAEQRIWAEINSPEMCKEWESAGEVTSDGLKRIIFGGEKI